MWQWNGSFWGVHDSLTMGLHKTSRPLKWKEQIRGLFNTSLLYFFDIFLKQQKLYLRGYTYVYEMLFCNQQYSWFWGIHYLPMPAWIYQRKLCSSLDIHVRAWTYFFVFTLNFSHLNNNCTHFSNLFKSRFTLLFSAKTNRKHFPGINIFCIIILVWKTYIIFNLRNQLRWNTWDFFP